MNVEVLVDSPHILQARISRAAEVQDEIRWQVLFLPQGGPASPSVITAFCPFTHIHASAPSVHLAARSWIKEAKRRFPGHSFIIPKYLLATCKVWYGDKPASAGLGVYAVDVELASKVVGFCPSTAATAEVMEGSESAPLATLEDLLSTGGQGVDGLTWAEWRVTCTPVMFSAAAAQSAHFTRRSLTPHCLN